MIPAIYTLLAIGILPCQVTQGSHDMPEKNMISEIFEPVPLSAGLCMCYKMSVLKLTGLVFLWLFTVIKKKLNMQQEIPAAAEQYALPEECLCVFKVNQTINGAAGLWCKWWWGT